MIFVQLPWMIIMLLPVILVEAFVVRWYVRMRYTQALYGVGRANILSTFIGVPMAWALMLIGEFAVMLPVGLAAQKWDWNLDAPVVQAISFFASVAWLPPVRPHLAWMIPMATLILLIPSFYLSVWIERRSCVKSWYDYDSFAVKRGVYAANIVSYALLFALTCFWLTHELHFD